VQNWEKELAGDKQLNSRLLRSENAGYENPSNRCVKVAL